MAWKPFEGEGDAKSVMVQASDIKWAEWLRVARNFQLRIGLKEKGKRMTFDGFLKEVCSWFHTLYPAQRSCLHATVTGT